MSQVSVKGEQSTSTEVDVLTNLTDLAASGPGEFIRKTSPTTFENDTPAGSAGVTVAIKKFITAGGTETITLDNTPDVIISVVINGGELSDNNGDWLQSGANINLLNANLPAGLWGKISYSY